MLDQDLELVFSHILIPVIGSVGVIGTVFSLLVLSRPKMWDMFHQLLFVLAIFDIVCIVSTSLLNIVGLKCKNEIDLRFYGATIQNLGRVIFVAVMNVLARSTRYNSLYNSINIHSHIPLSIYLFI